MTKVDSIGGGLIGATHRLEVEDDATNPSFSPHDTHLYNKAMDAHRVVLDGVLLIKGFLVNLMGRTFEN